MSSLFNEILFRPLFNLAIVFYNLIPGQDFGLAIIAVTASIRLVFLPLTIQSIRAQKALQSLNPKINEIKEKYKDDKQAQSAAIMRLYQENKINPLSGCLPLLIQIPVLIALYRVFLSVSQSNDLTLIYSFVENPGMISKSFLGLIDITRNSGYFAILAGVFQFIQAKISTPPSASGNNEMAALNTQMIYIFPLMIIFISWKLPIGLTIYWVSTTIFSIMEQMYVKYRY
jgi:YidC/Oxa1 family membrane protein insertase